jgi:4-hydroxybenzoate polyprenyltransferase
MLVTISGLVRLVRPRQWVKNVFVLAAPVYGGALFVDGKIIRALLAVAIFCALSGGVYIFNDLKDIEQDRLHPRKRSRPLASGEVSRWLAVLFGVVLLAVSLGGSYVLSLGLFGTSLCYLAINTFYTLWWKHTVILDIFCVASGFVLRVIAGALAVDVVLRPWILVCTLSLALLISLGKRRSEVVLLGEDAEAHRRTLGEYPLRFLDVLIVVASTMTVLAYSLFTFDSSHSRYLMTTIPFVLYGVFRYLYLIYVRGETDPPELILLHDAPMLVNGVLWGVLSAWLFHQNSP